MDEASTVTDRLTYACVTPARDERENLTRLADAMLLQTLRPAAWVIVDNGSVDGTVELAQELAAQHDWIELLVIPPAPRFVRGGPEVRAFMEGTKALDVSPGIVVKLDADVSFADDFFDRLVARFEQDVSLGIASGICLEEGTDGWHETYSTRSHARGATRAYRWATWEVVSPLEAHLSWDTLDELKARRGGWTVATMADIPFLHHRKMGTRDGAWRAWVEAGAMAHYISYRPSYVLVRTLYRSLREPAALGLVWGYASAIARRTPRYHDRAVLELLRDDQRLRHLRARILESRGRAVGDRAE